MTIQEAMKKRYQTTCPHCGKEIYVTRSMGMLIGFIDTGYGTCPHCNKMSAIKYNNDDTLTAMVDDITTKINSERSAAKVLGTTIGEIIIDEVTKPQ